MCDSGFPVSIRMPAASQETVYYVLTWYETDKRGEHGVFQTYVDPQFAAGQLDMAERFVGHGIDNLHLYRINQGCEATPVDELKSTGEVISRNLTYQDVAFAMFRNL